MTRTGEPEPVVVEVVGEISLANANDLGARIDAASDIGMNVQVDLARCEFIDSTGIAVLVRKARELREYGGELSVKNLRWDVERIFEIAGIFADGSPVARAAP